MKTFFLWKIYFSKNDLFCYLWGKYLWPLNTSLIFLKKIYDILMILVDFCGKFPRFWHIFATQIRFHVTELDPDPADQMKRVRIRNTDFHLSEWRIYRVTMKDWIKWKIIFLILLFCMQNFAPNVFKKTSLKFYQTIISFINLLPPMFKLAYVQYIKL